MKHLIQKSPIPASRAFVLKDLEAPFFDPNWHFHPEYQLFLVIKGKGTRFVGDNISPFKKWDLVLTGPNLPHLWRSDLQYFHKDSELRTHGIVIYFQESFLEGAIHKLEEFEQVRYLLQRSNYGLVISGETNLKLRDMILDMSLMSGAKSILQLLRILDVMSLSDEITQIASAGYTNKTSYTEADQMSRVLEHIMSNFTQEVTVEELASIANLSVTSFNRYFKSRTNKCFSEFLCEMRIGHACQLLLHSDFNISQICYESGFNTLSNFNRQFKNVTNNTPSEYKKEYYRSMGHCNRL